MINSVEGLEAKIVILKEMIQNPPAGVRVSGIYPILRRLIYEVETLKIMMNKVGG